MKEKNSCEICGKHVDRLISITIEGSKIMACEECSKMGKHLKPVKNPIIKNNNNEKEEVLVDDYIERINTAILTKYKNIIVFCKRNNIRISWLKKVLDKEIPLTLEEAKKFENILKVKLITIETEDILQPLEIKNKEKDVPRITLGDIIKKRLNIN